MKCFYCKINDSDLTYEPCFECKKKMKGKTTIIGVTHEPNANHIEIAPNLYPTGNFVKLPNKDNKTEMMLMDDDLLFIYDKKHKLTEMYYEKP